MPAYISADKLLSPKFCILHYITAEVEKARNYRHKVRQFLLVFKIFYKAARFLALSLLMALVLGTDNHNLAVSFDDLALVAHRLNRGSYFHNCTP